MFYVNYCTEAQFIKKNTRTKAVDKNYAFFTI